MSAGFVYCVMSSTVNLDVDLLVINAGSTAVTTCAHRARACMQIVAHTAGGQALAGGCDDDTDHERSTNDMPKILMYPVGLVSIMVYSSCEQGQ